MTTNKDRLNFMVREAQTANSTYKKLAVQCFVWQFCWSTNFRSS